MSLSKEIAVHLPYLRRYARALTGSQTSGDVYVSSALETILEDIDSFPKEHGVRVGLYKIFTSLWGSIDLNLERVAVDADGNSAPMRNFSRLTPRSRQAFLLKSVEEFSPAEIAVILDASAEDVAVYMKQAGREIAQCVATKALVIEDEAIISAELSMILRDLGHTVVGIARTRDEALRLAEKEQPGLILADIQLADGSSGIEAVNDILKITEASVIFITAFPERLLTGERPEPTFLISKPYRVDAVKATICQSLFFDQKAPKSRE
jgi:DNA-directed RNA polymerase specialized sigma24 family protein